MADLVCVSIGDDEKKRIFEELAYKGMVGARSIRPKRRELRRRIYALRAGAAPGPSGWRNSHIIKIADLPYGEDVLMNFACIVIGGRWLPVDALLWGAAILEPVDQGEKAPEVEGAPAQRKRRPI
eukprot:10298944-Karenia_brevis.AAC.1